MSHAVLVIEDEATLARNIQRYLMRHDYDTRTAGNGKEGLREAEAFKPDLILLDLQLPDQTGLEILSEIKKMGLDAKVIIMTAHGNVQTAVEAMKSGAYDYLSKPLILSELKAVLDKAIGQARLEGALSYYRERDAPKASLSALVGESPAMRAMKEKITRLLESEHQIGEGGEPPAVLITGETGTGKEVVARSIHYNGPRKDEPFVEINCASIPGHLLESELFGYERGAFTDAKERKRGLFEAADGGTLFLDEVGEMDTAMQTKLLKAIEEKTIRRLGSTRPQKVNIRILTATNQSLEELIRQGKFRSDLYFRLRVITIETPPLRERGSDILLLANYFLKKQCRRYRKSEMRMTRSAEELLCAYTWPGNVRELRNIIEQAVFMAQGEYIGSEQLNIAPALSKRLPTPGAAAESKQGEVVLPSEGISLEEVERNLVVQAIEQAAGNVTRAAKLLGLSRDTLRYRMEKYKIGSASKR